MHMHDVAAKMSSIVPTAIALAWTLCICAMPLAVAQTPPSAPYAGPKKSVFVDVVGAAEAMSGGAQPLGTTNEGLNAMLVDALMRTGRFVVVERVALGDIQLEQQLGEGGATKPESAAATGRMLGAGAIVRATVTKFEPNAGGSGLRIGVPFGRLLGGAGVNEHKAVVEFNLRIVDTTTGQVVATAKASGAADSSSASVGAMQTRTGASIDASTFHNTPLGAAAEAAIEAAVKQIVSGMERVPWSAAVVDVDNENVYVNAGVGQNLAPGVTLHVYRKDKVLSDPNTGEVLDVLMTDVGRIRVLSVREKVSIGLVVSGSPPARGDIVKLE